MQRPLHPALPQVGPWDYRGTLIINAGRRLCGYRPFEQVAFRNSPAWGFPCQAIPVA